MAYNEFMKVNTQPLLAHAWQSPLPFELVPTTDSMSFKDMGAHQTGLPLPPHPGAYGIRRANHAHEGCDLYAPQGTPVLAVEAGEVVQVQLFTGPEVGSEWWLTTYAVWVEGPSGVVLYGEVAPHVKVGQKVLAGEILGVVIRVLRKDKGRPRSMLHLELHVPGSREAPEWLDFADKPAVLRDPTPYLLPCCRQVTSN